MNDDTAVTDAEGGETPDTTPPAEPSDAPPVAPAPTPKRSGGVAIPVILTVVALLTIAALIASLVGYFSLKGQLAERDDRISALEQDMATVEAELDVSRSDLDAVSQQLDDVAAGAPATDGGSAQPLDIGAAAATVLPQFAGNGQPDAAIGRKLPDVAGEDFLTGEAVDIATDRPTMVMVWAHWCPYCQGELPIVQALYDEGVFDDAGVALMTIATFEDPTRGNPFEEFVTDFSFPVIRDDESRAARIGHSGVPAWVIVDKDGTVVGRLSGAFGEDGLRGVIDQVSSLNDG